MESTLSAPKRRLSSSTPNLDLSLLDYLKVVRGGELVEEETMASLELGHHSVRGAGEVTEGVNLKVLCQSMFPWRRHLKKNYGLVF